MILLLFVYKNSFPFSFGIFLGSLAYNQWRTRFTIFKYPRASIAIDQKERPAQFVYLGNVWGHIIFQDLIFDNRPRTLPSKKPLNFPAHDSSPELENEKIRVKDCCGMA